jgi:subtilase family serine protease
MYRLISTAMFSAAIALGATSIASAQSVAHPILRSGPTYHVALCGTAAVGYSRCHAHAVTDGAGNFVTATTPAALPSGWGAADLQSAYNITTSGSSSTTVAIVDAFGYNNAEADMGVYRATYGLPLCTTANHCFSKVNQNGRASNYPAQDSGWAGETALDLDMVSAMCPNCHILLVEANNNANANLAASVNTAAALGAHVISNSYGGGEGGSDDTAYNHAGVVITASTGDDGFGAQFPATSPHVIAVGGTHLVKSATTRGWTETTWAGAGSGCSAFFAKPAYQTDQLCAKRMEADISAVADPNTGVATYGPINFGFRSGWGIVGGTSVAAPLVGGIYGNAGDAQTTFAAPLYAGTSHLNDVTSGTNGSCGGTYFCTAGVGYDGPTGLGTPNGTTDF